MYSFQIYSQVYYFSLTPSCTFHPMGIELKDVNMETGCPLAHGSDGVAGTHLSLAGCGLRAETGRSLIPCCP